MNIDPKWGAYLGLLVVIEQAIGHGTVSLTNLVPADWSPYITSWCNFLAFVGTSIMTYQAAVSSNAPGPLANVPIPPLMKPVILLAIITGLSLFGFAGSAHAQATAQRPRVITPTVDAAPPSPSSPVLPTLTTYKAGAPHLLKLPNPLGLPDPMCITDHPTGDCPSGVTRGEGVKMSGSPDKDLADFLKRGGIALIRDMKRADQYLSAPTNSACTSGCTKIDVLGSQCLEALIPIGMMVVDGPASPDGRPVPTPSPSPSPVTGATAPATDTTPPRTTTAPAIDAKDEGIITGLAKQSIVLNALNGPSLKAGCAGFIQDKVQSAVSLGAGIMTFVTTLGLTGA